jgi:hypothetical protein
MGPKMVQGSRTDYNVVLRQTDDEQMLLNLVRMRYRDRALFLEVSALNTQFTFYRELNASTEQGQVDTLYGLGGVASVEESPTVSYTPLQGSDFVQRVLTPVSLDTLFLLDTSGWSAERLFRLLVDEMNTIENAAGANGPTPGKAPAYEDFKLMAHMLRALELDNLVAGAIYEDQPVLAFEPAAYDRTEYQEFTRILGLNPDKLVFPVTVAKRGASSESINLRFRSFAGVMYFLSQSVDVPQEDITAGRVTITRDPTGKPFDWHQVTSGLMQIHSSKKRPENAAVVISYRNHFFYIDDSDLDSKSTFSLLGQVFQLQSGNAKGAVPVLTIPIGN